MNPPPSPALIERMSAPRDPQPGPRYAAHFSGRTFDGDLRFDASGRLWVRTPRGNFSGRTVFDVFAPDLTYLGEVTIAEVLTYWHIGGSLLVGAGFSDLDIPIVKVWSVR